VNIENVAIYVGNKFYFYGFSIQPVYQVKKGFPSGKTSRKRIFLGPKISLVKGRNRPKEGYTTSK
jgi:hypothetical protein